MKKLLILPLALVLASCGDDPAARIARARAEIAAMELNAARIDLSAALEEKGDDAELLRLLAGVQLRLGDGDGAQTTLVRLEKIAGRSVELVRLQAEASLLRGLAKQALKLLGNDDSPVAWRIRAGACAALDDVDGQMEALRRGEAAGDDPLLLRDYAGVLLESSALGEAGRILAKLARLQPDGFDTLMLTADLAVRQQRYADAHRVLEKAAQLFPSLPDPLIARAQTYDAQDQLEKASAMAEAAARLAPDDHRTIELKVRLAAMKGEWETVRSTLAARENTLEPLSPNGLFYAEALLYLGHPEQARARLQRAVTRSPKSHYPRLMLAAAQMTTNDPAAAYATVKPLADSLLAGMHELELAEAAARQVGLEAEADVLKTRLATISQNRALALAKSAEAAVARADWAEAIAAYRQVSKMGNDTEVLRRLAMVLSQSGQADEAIATADRALAIAPDDPEMIHLAGYVRAKAGKELPTAHQMLQQASAADPANVLFRRDAARFVGKVSG